MTITAMLKEAIKEYKSKRLVTFRNYYRCCGSEWERNHVWSDVTPDRCQKCRGNVLPYRSEALIPFVMEVIS